MQKTLAEVLMDDLPTFPPAEVSDVQFFHALSHVLRNLYPGEVECAIVFPAGRETHMHLQVRRKQP